MKKISKRVLAAARKAAKEAGTLPNKPKRKVTSSESYDKSEVTAPTQKMSFCLKKGEMALFTHKFYSLAGTTCIIIEKVDDERYSVLCRDGQIRDVHGIYLRPV